MPHPLLQQLKFGEAGGVGNEFFHNMLLTCCAGAWRVRLQP